MINFDNAKFITSFVSKPQDLEQNLPEILFVGRSNCGKSSLINALTNKKNLAHTSSKPGYTKLLNYFNVDNKFYLVDAPGYGFAQNRDKAYLDFGKLMEDYLTDNPYLKLVLLLLDSRRVPNEDDYLIYNYLNSNHIPFAICMTKIDKLNMSEKAKINKNLESKNIKIPAELKYFTSSMDVRSLAKLKEFIEKTI